MSLRSSNKFVFAVDFLYICTNLRVSVMHRLIFFLFLLILPARLLPLGTGNVTVHKVSECRDTYSAMGLDKIVSYRAFEQAYYGWKKIKSQKPNVMTLIDFSKPSTDERLYVFDMKMKKVLFISHVAHGRNSGGNYATSFSNINGSHQSSLGFYLTGSTYIGKNGYSLLLDGLEKGINDKARERAIVIHGAAYANPSVIGSSGRLGRSFGCPALPQAVNKAIIDVIKGGSLLYIYADDSKYVAQSQILAKPIATL